MKLAKIGPKSRKFCASSIEQRLQLKTTILIGSLTIISSVFQGPDRDRSVARSPKFVGGGGVVINLLVIPPSNHKNAFPPLSILSIPLFFHAYTQTLSAFSVFTIESLATVMISLLSSPVARLGLAIISCLVFLHVCILPGSLQPQRQPQFQLVLSHYNENLSDVKEWVAALREMPFVKELGSTVTVYTKNKHVNLDQIKEILDAAEVIRLPNVGREQGTFMHHINKTYDHMYPYTMFSQAAITGLNDTGNVSRPFADWLDESLRFKMTNETKFFNLQNSGKPIFCVCGVCPTGYYPLLPQIQALVDNKICDSTQKQSISWLGQFIVAKERVIARPRWIYEYIGSLVDAPEGHWIHQQQEPAALKKALGESLPDNPFFGHTVERIWPTLFNCSNELEMQGCMGSWTPTPKQMNKDRPFRELSI